VKFYSNNKAPNHQLGSIHVTSHRLIYIDSLHPRRRSIEFDLRRITQTEFYAGFLKSSPKITIFFQPPTLPEQQQPRETTFRWECGICGNINIFTGLVPPTACQLCGVPRSTKNAPQIQSSPSSEQSQSQTRSIPTSRSSLLTPGPSKSLPSSSLPTPYRVPSPAMSARTGNRIENDAQLACPACTFLNHPSLRNCEICGTALPRPTIGGPSTSSTIINHTNKSAPSSRPPSPDGTREDILKVSFRRGGDKAFYAALKSSLEAKVWDIVEPQIIAKNRTGIRAYFIPNYSHPN
jgi:ESCRT-II complex subunit VPS36